MNARRLGTALLLVLAADIAHTNADQTDQETARSLVAIQADLRDALRREAVAPSDAVWCESLERLCDLFTEIRRHPRLEDAELLQKAAVRLRVRLRAARQELEKQWRPLADSSDGTLPGALDRPIEAAGDQPLGPTETAHPTEAQGGDSPSESKEPDSLAQLAAQALSDQWELAGATSGGPAGYWVLHGAVGDGARGGGAFADFAPSLIELIQSTIEPDHWDVAGGPGTIRYYRPVFALVVRASSHVHPQIGGFLGGVRK